MQDVSGEAENPGAEIAAQRIEVGRAGEDSAKNLLHDILRFDPSAKRTWDAHDSPAIQGGGDALEQHAQLVNFAGRSSREQAFCDGTLRFP